MRSFAVFSENRRKWRESCRPAIPTCLRLAWLDELDSGVVGVGPGVERRVPELAAVVDQHPKRAATLERDLVQHPPRREVVSTSVDNHANELHLARDGIGHRNTRIRSPRTNGFVERMNRTLLDECFRLAGRTNWYVERDLDRFLAYYNLEHSHQGYRLKGRAPAQALREALGVEQLPLFVPDEENATTPAA